MSEDFASTQGQNFYLNNGAFNSLYNHDKLLTLLVPIIVCKFFSDFSHRKCKGISVNECF